MLAPIERSFHVGLILAVSSPDLGEVEPSIGRVPSPESRGIHREGKVMTKLWAVLLILVSFLLVAPVIESGTSGYSSTVFQAIGTAEGGGGAG